MVTATISQLKQISMDDWKLLYHSKDFQMAASLQEIETWARTIAPGCTIHDVQLSVKHT